jgi:NAD(P)-dependent dehydrogenase (short-subunit alcohol dehydrogenase family)
MSLAVYLAAQHIRVNCICPGSIDSPMIRVFIDRSGNLKGEALENAVRANAQNAPLNRMAKPEEIANLALFLLSDESSFITGTSVTIDGGKLAKM